MTAKIGISYYMTGDGVELDDMTKALNLQPSRIRRKNDWPQASILAGIAHDAWELQIEKEESNSVSLQMDKLQNILLPKVDVIKKLSKKYFLNTNVTIVINMEAGDGPEMVFSRENIEFLSLINAEVGFDLYID